MVYRLDPVDVRHAAWPLRLGAAGTDAVVEAHRIRCSHFDAFRFFTPDAAPLNALAADPGEPAALEQPGCLHAGMDLYKWAYKLVPAVPERAGPGLLRAGPRRSATLDMRASPYDLARARLRRRSAIETPEGKAAYVAAQRGFAARGQALRARLVDAVDAVDAALCLTAAPD